MHVSLFSNLSCTIFSLVQILVATVQVKKTLFLELCGYVQGISDKLKSAMKPHLFLDN